MWGNSGVDVMCLLETTDELEKIYFPSFLGPILQGDLKDLRVVTALLSLKISFQSSST